MRRAVRTVAKATEVEASQKPTLQFDFKGAPVPPSAPVRTHSTRDDSIKQAIIRWLNEEL